MAFQNYKMEQPTLSSNQPHLPDVHEISNTLAGQKRRPPLLRRVSRSDPNFQPEEQPKFDALQHVLHGIAEVNSGLSINKLGFDNEPNYLSIMPLDQSKSSSAVPTAFDTQKPDQTLERKLSAFNLGIQSNDPNSSLGSIRKAASFIHGTNFGIGLNTPTNYFSHPQHRRTPNFSIGGGSNTFHTSSVSPPVEGPSHQSGGLSMQVCSKNNSLAPTKTNEVQHSSSMAGGLFSNAGTDTSANNTHVGGMIANASTDSLPRQKTGVMGMFGRGFFAKPVIRSEEENYRYIMALDR